VFKDSYLKIVLTLIAICLIKLAFGSAGSFALLPSAQAAEKPGTRSPASEPLKVVVVEVKSPVAVRPVANEAIPVYLKGVNKDYPLPVAQVRSQPKWDNSY
jgi:hypothetical protein